MIFEARQRDAAWATAVLNTHSRTRNIAAWSLAVAAPILLAAVTQPVRGSLGLSGYLFCALVVVVATALIGGVSPALAAVLSGSVAGAFVFAPPYESARVYLRLDNAPLVAFIVVGAATAVLVASLTRLLAQQTALRQVEAALRRVATLVASAAPTEVLFEASTAEVGALLGAARVALARLETDGTLTTLSSWPRQPDAHDLSVLVPQANGDAPQARFADPQIHATVDAPIVLESRVWGMMVAGASTDHVMPAKSGERLKSLTDLLATAIANAESRNELAASRARVVAAADLARRQIERDLHDGAQQQLVSLALGLRAAQTTVPAHLADLSEELSRVAEGLGDVQEELREIARGIHPAILAQGGVAPALRTLARRCALPVTLELQVDVVDDRLAEPIEVAIYYIVAEALTNTVKHANASTIDVRVAASGNVICITVRDDGAGGVDPRLGSGLLGLKDRVGALGGTITLDSPHGAGTRLEAEIPISASPGGN